MNNESNKTKLRFGVLDAVVLIIVIALAVALIFRFTSDIRLFSYDTEEYVVTVKACGLQYTTMSMMSSSDAVYLEGGEYLGNFTHAPTVTPMLKYEITPSGSMVAAYYPDNTLVDISTDIVCDLVENNGMIMTKDGEHIAVGAVLKVHTQTVDFEVEIIAVEKVVSE